jgi:hypothetical protein
MLCKMLKPNAIRIFNAKIFFFAKAATTTLPYTTPHRISKSSDRKSITTRGKSFQSKRT